MPPSTALVRSRTRARDDRPRLVAALAAGARVARSLRLVATCLTLSLGGTGLHAQELDHPLKHLLHTQWTSLEGIPTSNYTRVMRSGDGYLWLGSTSGLVRFDGVRFVTIDSTRSPAMRMLPGVSYSMLDDSHPLVARMVSMGLTLPLLTDADGAMWVATPDGRLLHYRDGTFKVVLQSDPKIGRFTDMVRDRSGRIWLQGNVQARLYELRGGRVVAPSLPADAPRQHITRVLPDTGDGLWIGTRDDDLYHVSGMTVRHLRQPDAGRIRNSTPFVQARDGTVWVQGRLLYRIVNDVWIPTESDKVARTSAVAATLLPDGAALFATRGSGLVRWKNGVLDTLSQRDGLSSESVRDVLVDQEDNVWALTDAGLDRLRSAPFATISARNGLPIVAPATLRFAGDGALWTSSGAITTQVVAIDLQRLLAGLPSAVATVKSLPPAGFYTPFTALPRGEMLFQENTGQLVRRVGARMTPFVMRDAPVAKPVIALTTRDSSVWLGSPRGDIGRVVDGVFRPVVSDELKGASIDVLVEGNDGEVWIASRERPIIEALRDDRIVRRVGKGDGLTEPIAAVAVGRGDTLFAAGVSGTLMRIAGGRLHAYQSSEVARIMRAGSPSLVAGESALWLFSDVGIASIATSALATSDSVVPRVYGALDGLPVARVGRARFGAVTTDRMGRIWVSTPAGLAVTNPATLHPNEYAPLVHVEEVVASGARLAPLPDGTVQVPPSTDRLEISFTATALRVPERVRLEYQLVGVDRGWVASGATRTASYTNVRPRRYTFRVRAWNEDGVPATSEATLSLRILPAWYQTIWASAAGVALLLSIGSFGAWRWQHARAAQREARLHERFHATLEERTRVARELHDTLLNGFTGITLQLQGLQDTLGTAPEKASERLARILTRADEALSDARQAIWDMRRSADRDESLGESLEHAARDAVDGSDIEVHLVVSGAVRPLTPTVEETLRRVGSEAVRNAARHAGARQVRLELAYRRRDVQLIVRDDGRGLDAGAAEAARAAGHYGLSGMRERAEAAGGSLEVTGVADEGTIVALSLPVLSG